MRKHHFKNFLKLNKMEQILRKIQPTRTDLRRNKKHVQP